MPIHKKLRTPYIKPRTQGGTFYTFSSALEDIGLNINELRNKVSMSHYVLLNIPEFPATANPGDENANIGDYSFAETLQNYALNMETVVRNQPSYSFSDSLTVSERVFWKMMKTKFGAEFEKEDLSDYWKETTGLVKGFGRIAAGSQRSDSYGIYNETYIQIPSSYGEMCTLFKSVSDRNYHKTGDEPYAPYSDNGYIENVDEDDITEGMLPTGLSAEAQFDTEGYSVDDDEMMCVEFSLPALRSYFGDDTLTYDTMGIQGTGIPLEEQKDSFEYNAILVYYSIYDTSGNILATNAYGILVLNNAVSSDNGYTFPTITKKRTTSTSAGNSFSIRINIKTSTVYSGDIIVHDESTGAYEMSSDFNEMIRHLGTAIDTLKSNANLILSIENNNEIIKKLALRSLQDIDDIKKDIANIKTGKTKNIKAKVVVADRAEFARIMSDTTFHDASTGTDVGSISGNTFQFDNIESDKIEAKVLESIKITTPQIQAKSDSLSITNEKGDTNYLQITEGGLHVSGDVYVPSHVESRNEGEHISMTSHEGDDEWEGGDTHDSVEDIFKQIDIVYDGNGGFRLELPALSDISGTTAEFVNSLLLRSNSQDDVSDIPGDDSAYNLLNLLYLAIAEICILQNEMANGTEDSDDAVVKTFSGTTLSCTPGKYYTASSEVNTLAITLPAVKGNLTKIVRFNFATGSTPCISFTSANSKPINYYADYEISANKEYEVKAMYNGAKWIISSEKIVATPPSSR